MSLILHSTRRCPFCIRVRILLHLKAVDFELVEEPLRKWTDWMRAWGDRTGERMRVPVLRSLDASGVETIYTESNDINEMVDKAYGDITYTPALYSSSYLEMKAWMKWCDDILKPQIDLFKYGEKLEFDHEKHDEHTNVLRGLIGTLEQALLGKKHLTEDRLTLADIAIIPFIRQIMRTREGEFDFTDFPNVKSWTFLIIETPWFTDVIMKK